MSSSCSARRNACAAIFSQLSWLSVILGAAAVIVADNKRISKNVDMLCSRSLQFNNADIGRQHRGVLAEDFERTRVIFRRKDEGWLAHFAATFQCSVSAPTLAAQHVVQKILGHR